MGIDLCCSFFSNIEGAGETAFCFDLKNGSINSVLELHFALFEE